MSTWTEAQLSYSTDGIEELEDEEEPPGIAVLYSAVDDVVRGEARDLVADLEVVDTADRIAAALRSRGRAAIALPVRGRVSPVLKGLDPGRTLIFNLVENLDGRPSGEAEAARIFARAGFSYSGSAPATLMLCLDKGRTKARLVAHGMPTAPYQVFRTVPPRQGAWLHVPLPAMVKPLAEDASHGIHRKSVVRDVEELYCQVEYVLDVYRQPALVERFLDGREFNIGVWGPGQSGPGALHILPLAELDFSRWSDPLDRVCNFEAKWDAASVEYSTMPVICPAEVEPDLAERLRQTALRSYLATGCRDYARIDMRLCGSTPYVLEVNPNPCLAADAGFAQAARVAGYDYGHMVDRIATWAWMRHLDEARTRVRTVLVPGWQVRQPVALAGSD